MAPDGHTERLKDRPTWTAGDNNKSASEMNCEIFDNSSFFSSNF